MVTGRLFKTLPGPILSGESAGSEGKQQNDFRHDTVLALSPRGRAGCEQGPPWVKIPTVPASTRRQLLLSLAAAGLETGLTARAAPVEFQPFASQVRRVLAALQYLGEPLTAADAEAVDRAMRPANGGRSVEAIEQILDKHVLAIVTINPESRVSVAPGAARPLLVEKGWRIFLVKVRNESGLTSRLRFHCPEALPDSGHAPGSEITPTGVVPRGASRPVQSISALDVGNRWLGAEMFDKQPLTPELSGLGVEYRILQLYSRDRGQREARLGFTAGPGTEDIGFRNSAAVLFTCLPAHEVRFQILDVDGTPATASLLITDSYGRVYPLPAKRLAPDFPFQSEIYRASGQAVRLPPGEYSLSYSRGPEYLVRKTGLSVPAAGAPGAATLRLQRWVNPAALGWYPGDHHIHAAGCAHYNTPSEGVLPADIAPQVRGEGLAVGDVLTWGPSWYYQKQFFRGAVDPHSGGQTLLRYDVEVSGFPSSYWGHLALLDLKEQDYPGTREIEEWPTWNLPILKWAKAQGAVAGYAHSGHGLSVESREIPNYLVPRFDDNGANEFLIDVAHGAVDFLSGVDTPASAELNIWYHALNCGFRTPLAGETDFPCLFDKVGVGRTYVYLAAPPRGDHGYRDWIAGLKNGHSYVSDGRSHILDGTVGHADLRAQNELHLDAPGRVRVRAKVAARLEERPGEEARKIRASPLESAPYWHIERARAGESRKVSVELIVNGRAVDSKTILADGTLQDVEFLAMVEQSSWLALRILYSSHTNPMFVTVARKPVRASRRSCQWCLDSIAAAWNRLGPRIAAKDRAAAAAARDHALETFHAILRDSGG